MQDPGADVGFFQLEIIKAGDVNSFAGLGLDHLSLLVTKPGGEDLVEKRAAHTKELIHLMLF